MKKLVFGLSAVITLGLATSCGGSSSSTDGQVDTLTVKGEVLIPYEKLKMPGVVYANNDRLCIGNSMQADSLFEIWTLDGKKLYSCLQVGQGPDEVPFIYYQAADKNSDRIVMMAAQNTMKALEGISTGAPHLETIFTTSAEKSGVTDSLQIPIAGMSAVVMANGVVVTGNSTLNGLLTQYTPDGRLIRYDVNYPPSSEFGDGLPVYSIYNFMQPRISTSPDGKHFVSYYGMADMISFGTVDGDSVIVKTDYVSAPKGINVVVGDGFVSFSYDDNLMEYYSGYPRLSNKYAYCRYVGRLSSEFGKEQKAMAEGEIPAATQLRVYDFDGNLHRIINLDCVVRSFDVSPDDSTLYVLTETDEDGIHLLRYNLK